MSGIQLEEFRAEELADRVELIASTVFEHGMGSSIRKLIQGELSTEIHKHGHVDLTIGEFFDDLNFDRAALELAGTLKSILAYHSGGSASQICREFAGHAGHTLKHTYGIFSSD